MCRVALLSILAVGFTGPAVRADAETEGALLRALGGATAAYLYETHQKIGIIVDARSKKSYDQATCDREIQVSINVLKVIDKQMGELLKSELADSEKKTVRQVKSIISGQLKSAEALKSYWENRDPDDLDTYKVNRVESWKELKKLMGLKDNPGGVRRDDED